MFAPLGFDNEKFKTELCVKFQELGTCPYNTRCRFAHGEAELRAKPKPKQYKTKPCNNFIRTGKCPYGARCNFLHGEPGSQVAAMQATHAQQQAMRTQSYMNRMPPQHPHPGHLPQAGGDPSAMAAGPGTMGGNPGAAPMTYQQRMRSRQQQGWENFMVGTKHSSGCFNVKTVRGFHCERPPISERFQAWKEMRGEGELPQHVLVLQDNQKWIVESKQKEESKQLLLAQQEQYKELRKLLLSSNKKDKEAGEKDEEEDEDDDEDDDESDDSGSGSDANMSDRHSRRHRRKRHRRRGSRHRSRHRKRRRRDTDDDDDVEDSKDERVKKKSRSSRSRSQSRSRSSRSDNEENDVHIKKEQSNGNNSSGQEDVDQASASDSANARDTPMNDGDTQNDASGKEMDEMPLPE